MATDKLALSTKKIDPRGITPRSRASGRRRTRASILTYRAGDCVLRPWLLLLRRPVLAVP